MKRTPLYNEHLLLNGMISDFGEWELPEYYSSAFEECSAANTSVVIMDSSASGKFTIKGKDAEALVQKVVISSAAARETGNHCITFMCNEYGGIIDKVSVYRIADNEFLLTGNNQAIEKDYRWIQTHLEGDTEISNISEEIAKIDCIGPFSSQLLSEIFNTINISEIKPGRFISSMYDGRPVFLSQTTIGRTPCFEIFLHSESAVSMWKNLLSEGINYGIHPAGRDAYFLFSLQNGEPLYEYEISESVSPAELNVNACVDSEIMFIGHSVICDQIENGAPRTLISLNVAGNSVPERGTILFCNETDIGIITRAGMIPPQKEIKALALIKNKSYSPKQGFTFKKKDKLFTATLSVKNVRKN
jgi:aminomethyltransferase